MSLTCLSSEGPGRSVCRRPQGAVGGESSTDQRVITVRTSAELETSVGDHQMWRRPASGTVGIPSSYEATGKIKSYL